MSYGTGARQDFGAHNHRNSSRRTNPYTMISGAFVACLMLGCAWTVYANVFGASVYPAAIVGNFDVAVVKRPPAPAVQSAAPAFDDVFVALSAPAPLSSARVNLVLGPSLTFNDRFAASSPQGEAPRPQPVSPPADRQVAALTPSPDRQVAQMARLPVPRPADAGPKNAGASVREMTQSAKAAVLAAVAEKEKPTIFEKLFGKLKSSGSTLAYASADASATASVGPTQNSALGGSAPYDRSTAVYDISARTVYMPDGTKLEAHSGLGSKLDDPKFVHVKMSGATPPHVYDLEPREALFHGVPALRLTPVGGDEAIFGRSGLLAHTYMLGPNGDSNGCVSFKDYNAFLNAYRNGEVKRLAVVSRLD
jgi:type VI secretion system (T6SS) effector TldE1-like protein